MNRRDAPAAAGSVGVAAAAGCTGLGSATIANREKERADSVDVDPRFRTESGEEVATVAITPGRRRYAGHGGAEIPVKIAITHGEPTTIERVRLALRAPPTSTGGGVPAAVAFTTPFAKPHPAVELYTDPDDGSTVLEIPETDEQGDGTAVFDFLLTGVRDATTELSVDVAVELSESGVLGRSYALERPALVPLPDETG
jgi:hypothetical protein